MTDIRAPRKGIALALACFLGASAVLALFIGFAPTGQAQAQTADVPSIDQEIANLESRVASLENRLAALEQHEGAERAQPPPPAPVASPPAAPAPAPVVSATGMGRIDQNGGTYNGGWSTFVTGHGFGADEEVTVTSNGSLVTTAQTGPNGDFSATIPLPAAAGAYIYTFTGQSSGTTASATLYSRRSTTFFY